MSEAIPIVNSLTGETTGSITVDEDGNAIISGRIDVPWGASEIEQLVIVRPPQIVSDGMPSITEPPDPVLAERLASSFPSAYDRFLAEGGEQAVAAAARGLAVHERALTLSEERQIPYHHAIQIAAEER